LADVGMILGHGQQLPVIMTELSPQIPDESVPRPRPVRAMTESEEAAWAVLVAHLLMEMDTAVFPGEMDGPGGFVDKTGDDD
jgi:hypothetical protein